MQIKITGLPSGYEIEHLIRLFFPGAPLGAGRVEGDLLHAHRGKKHLYAVLRINGKTVWQRCRPTTGHTSEYDLSALVYELLRKETGVRPPWGMMTGVRPVRIIHDVRRAGLTEDAVQARFMDEFDCSEEKFRLAKTIADLQAPILASNHPLDYSLYIGIPFCPSRCSYCSFVSRTTQRDGQKQLQPYVDKLCLEIAAIRDVADKNHLHLRTIYIGGGTPTSLTADQLRQLMGCVRNTFDLSEVEEYTVEAGRPDCTDEEKLRVLKEYGATRISINPQTFSDEVLRNIGRKHSAQDILDCFATARAVGHDDINMDLIAGLPGDTEVGFAASLAQTMALAPENITVHTLTLKRASNLVIEHRTDGTGDVEAMLRHCDVLPAAGYRPYYLYRQKNTLGNLENTGWCKPGHEGLYNIFIMEEVHTILSAGAGGSTKLVWPCKDGSVKIERIFNYKYPTEYIDGFDEILKRKEGVSAFYGRNLDT